MKKFSVLIAGVTVLALSPAANAAVTIEEGPSVVQPSENVQLDTDILPGDNVLRGTTNQTNSTVLFESSSDNLAAPPQGQARIEPLSPTSADGLNQLTFGFENGSTFTSAEFNILASLTGTVTLTALDSANMILESIMPTISSSGQNFFGFIADSSTPISSITITSGTGQIASIGQFRVGGVTAPSAVPEPTTWAMMLVGFGMLGGAMRRRAKIASKVSFAA